MTVRRTDHTGSIGSVAASPAADPARLRANYAVREATTKPQAVAAQSAIARVAGQRNIFILLNRGSEKAENGSVTRSH